MNEKSNKNIFEIIASTNRKGNLMVSPSWSWLKLLFPQNPKPNLLGETPNMQNKSKEMKRKKNSVIEALINRCRCLSFWWLPREFWKVFTSVSERFWLLEDRVANCASVCCVIVVVWKKRNSKIKECLT